jgi:ABC-2 type transport system permease protein
MNKVLAVAQTEFRALVRSKAFLVTVILMPLIMFGTSFMQKQMSEHADTRPRRFAVIDRSGTFMPILEAQARLHNADARESPTQFVPVATNATGDARALDDLRVSLSDQIKREELFAFVEIPAEPDVEPLHYSTEHPAVEDLPNWLSRVIDAEVHARRYREARLDDATIVRLERQVHAEHLGLWTRDADGRVHAEKLDVVKEVIVPLVPPILLFLFVAMSTPQLLNSVLTEKTSRISEVLLASLTPFQLMLGKLLGSVAVSLVLGGVYLAGGLTIASRMGYAGAIPVALVGWFLLFLVLAMMLFGSIAIAVGAACNDQKDAQNLMMPVMLPTMLPMFALGPIVQSPSSPLAKVLSLFPLSAPTTMLLRIGLHPSAPLWQILIAVAGTTATAIFVVWAAGRIFRVGLLMQGKSASVGQMVSWIFSA